MPPTNCPLCSSTIRAVQINYLEAVYMCPNTQCIYPIGVPGLSLELINQNYKELTFTRNVTTNADISSKGDHMNDFSFLEDFFSKSNSLTLTPQDIEEVDLLFESLQSSNTSIHCDDHSTNTTEFLSCFNNTKNDDLNAFMNELGEISFENALQL